MESSAQLRRLSLESLAIVGSILLAFAIDAWWEDSKEEQRRQILLDDLKSETAGNIEFLTSIIQAQELHSRQLTTLSRAMRGAEQLSSTELEDLRRQAPGAPIFTPSWGILDLLITSGDLVLIEDSKLRAALVNLKAQLSHYLENQQAAVNVSISDVARYESGTHLFWWNLPENEDSIDSEVNLRQLEVALKTLQTQIGLYETLIVEQGKRALEHFQEVYELLP